MGLALGLLVVARTQSLAVAAAVTAVATLAAHGTATRAAVLVLGGLTLVGVPWIASPLVAGVVWLVLAHGTSTLARARTELRRTARPAVLVVVGVGLVAGLVAAPFSRAQANVTPIVFDVVRPSALVMVAGVAVLAVANSVGEELLWRGALAHEGRVLPVAAQYCLQVVSFGLAHWHGLPGGWAGCLLTGVASAVFFWIHRRWGIVASVLAHVVADVVIFAAVLPLVLFTGWAAAAA